MKNPSKTIGLLSPGDMGHVVGQILIDNGLRVITCLQDRSKRTKELAQQVNIEDVSSYEILVNEADIILAILVPNKAKSTAERVAQAISKSKADIIYVDCNAIAPQTMGEIDAIIRQAGGRCVDASIIGPPPRKAGTTRFYASGKDVSEFEVLNNFGLQVISMGEHIGHASAIKMCYASLTKGLTALGAELLTAAQALGVFDTLKEELQLSQAMLFERFERGLPQMPPKSRRWVGEMEEIASTFEDVGLTPKILAGAADIYRLVGATELADRTPEEKNEVPTLEEMLAALNSQIQAQ